MWSISKDKEKYLKNHRLYYIMSIFLSTVILVNIVNMSSNMAVEVFIENAPVAVVSSAEEFEGYIEKANKELSEEIGKDVEVTAEPIFVEKSVMRKELTSENLILSKLKNMDYGLVGYGIYVDGSLEAVFEDEASANFVLESIRKHYIELYGSEDLTFDKKVEIEKASTKKFDDKNEAIERFIEPGSKFKTAVVEDGDTLWDIAVANNMTTDEILELNFGLTENIKPGQVLSLTEPEYLIGAKIVEIISYESEIKHPLENIENSSMYIGDFKVIEKGENGVEKITAQITKINGMIKEEEILERVVLKEPKTQVQNVGTLKRPENIASGSFIRPTGGVKTSSYGSRWGRMHNGVDFAGNTGDAIYAADGGKVVFAGVQDGYGNFIQIDHENGYVTAYAHCSKLLFKVGDCVHKGQVIARVGNTGRSTGPHLHFEVIKNGQKINPEALIGKKYIN